MSCKVDTLISFQKPNMRKLFARVCVTLSVLVHATLTVQMELKPTVACTRDRACTLVLAGEIDIVRMHKGQLASLFDVWPSFLGPIHLHNVR